jgi:hypothetical protein
MALSTIASLLDHVSIFAFRHRILDFIRSAATEIPEVLSQIRSHCPARTAAWR